MNFEIKDSSLDVEETASLVVMAINPTSPPSYTPALEVPLA
jgi:hypothetical protein